MAIDEENLGYRDDELGNVDAFNGEDSRITTESTAFLAGQHNETRGGAADIIGPVSTSRLTWLSLSRDNISRGAWV